MHTYIHAYIHVMHTYIHAYIYTYLHTYIYTYLDTYIHCGGQAAEQCPTWPHGGHKGRQMQPRAVVLDGRYFKKL